MARPLAGGNRLDVFSSAAADLTGAFHTLITWNGPMTNAGGMLTPTSGFEYLCPDPTCSFPTAFGPTVRGIAGGTTLTASPTTEIVVPPAGAQCTMATCTGDLRAGIDANAPLTDLNVHSLTQNITPAGGADGIDFFSAAGDVSINVDTGAFVIATTGDNADGFEVFEGGVSGPGAGNCHTRQRKEVGGRVIECVICLNGLST